MHDILEVMILNSDLDFENSDLKVYFFAKFSLKKLSCLFYLKMAHMTYGGVDFKSGLRFSKFRPKNLYLDKLAWNS